MDTNTDGEGPPAFAAGHAAADILNNEDMSAREQLEARWSRMCRLMERVSSTMPPGPAVNNNEQEQILRQLCDAFERPLSTLTELDEKLTERLRESSLVGGTQGGVLSRDVRSKTTGWYLPDELTLCVFNFLSASELCKAAEVCKQWYPLANDKLLWGRVLVVLPRTTRDTDMHILFRQHPSVTRLCITSCHSVTHQGLLPFYRSRQLTELQMRDCRLARDTNVSMLALESGHTVTNLLLNDNRWITEVGVRDVFSYCPNLTVLEMGGCKNIGDSAFDTLEHAPNLTFLGVSRCLFKEKVFHKIADSCPNLHIFAAGRTQVTDATVSYMTERLTNLRKLYLRQTNISGSSMVSIHNCASLTALNVSDCSSYTDVCCEQLALGCPQLSYVYFGNLSITDSAVSKLAEHCHKIRVLFLNGCVQLTDACLRPVACGMPDMEEISLERCRSITDKGLTELTAARCPRLARIFVTRTQAADESMFVFAELGDTLRILSLDGTQVSDVGIAAIGASCPRLTKLWVRFCHQVSIGALKEHIQERNARCVVVTERD